MEIKNGLYNENDDIYKNVKDYYMDFKNRIVKPEKKPVAPVKAMGTIIIVPWNEGNHWYDVYDDDIPLTEPIFKITRNAKRDENLTSNKQKSGSKKSSKRRKGEDGVEYSCNYSDDSDEDVIPPKIYNGTINSLYKEYIKNIDLEKYPEFSEITRKYVSRGMFIIDKSEHKKEMKKRKREAKKIK